MTLPTVALVDDHALVVHALSAALTERGIRCIPIVPGPISVLLTEITAIEPAVALLDLDLGPHGSSIPLIAPLVAAGVRVLILTGHNEPLQLARALEAGALRIIMKGAGFTELVETVSQVTAAREPESDPAAAELLAMLAAHERRESEQQSGWESLTLRERETLAALAQSRTVREIAKSWTVAETTVRSHVRSILQKLGVQSQLQAVVTAVHHGWVDPEPHREPSS